MLKVLYLVHDLADPAVRRRVLMLQAGGAEVTLAGFRRGDNALAAVEGVTPIDLGVTADGRFAQRLGAVAKACLTIGAKVSNLARPDLIVARNLEMLAVANRATSVFGGDVPLAYECLDIHRLLLRDDMVGKALRGAEARLGRKAALLLTSSPAFIEHYFRPLSGLDLPSLLLQNQVIDLDDDDRTEVAAMASPAPAQPWRIGWFGALRCARSLDLLTTFSHAMAGRVDIVLRGRPAYSQFDDFDGLVRNEPFLSFHGPYRNPEDLARIYSGVHFSWAIDFFEEGQNSSWLLPNRLYESCRHGTVPIALEGTETARFLTERGLGFILPDAAPDRLADLFETMTDQTYRKAVERIRALGPGPWTFNRADCQRLVKRLSTLAVGQPAVRPLAQPIAAKETTHDE
ncbi:MAG: glycosyl transferase family 1 [Rhizobium sp.]|nr:glycosyl transferase family 1 [Rhizobium sp.]